MKTISNQRNISTRAGISLVEITISTVVCAIVGYGLVSLMDSSQGSMNLVTDIAGENDTLRESNQELVHDLQNTTDAQITVTTLGDGNHEVNFMTSILVGGAPAWGVWDRSFGPDAASQNKEDWSLRYTVETVIESNGSPNRKLVRQILDADQAVFAERVVAEHLEPGTADPPGFSVIQTGDMWEIKITTSSDHASSTRRLEFHVLARN